MRRMDDMRDMREPTAEECRAKAEVRLNEKLAGRACWYPQMGGYWGKAVAVVDEDCVDVYVWHNGDFPFSSDHPGWDGQPPNPALLHHCDGEQFVNFGKFLMSLQED
jgi:hypothetical protein